jgi:hypothetical protein
MNLDELDQFELNIFCRELGWIVFNYMQDKEHQKEFEKWYLKEYGEPYVWKTLADKEKERKSRENDERRIVEAPC